MSTSLLMKPLPPVPLIPPSPRMQLLPGLSRANVTSLNGYCTEGIHPLPWQMASSLEAQAPSPPKHKRLVKAFVKKLNFQKRRVGIVYCCASGIADSIHHKKHFMHDYEKAATLVLGLGLLIASLCWLQHITVDQGNLRLAICLGFSILFCLSMATVTVAKPLDVITVTLMWESRDLYMTLDLLTRTQIPGGFDVLCTTLRLHKTALRLDCVTRM